MEQCRKVFIGIDVAKTHNAIAVADSERGGEVRYLGRIDAASESMRWLVKRLAAEHEYLHVCYEAAPAEYGLYRSITGPGQPCAVLAPSLIPRRPGNPVKTIRRGALVPTKLLRAGELTAGLVPDKGHEASAHGLRLLGSGRALDWRNRPTRPDDLDVRSRCVVVRLISHGGTRYGTGSPRKRHDD